MNPFNLPNDHFEARKMILIESTSASMQCCVEYINERYERRTLLQQAINFCTHDLNDTPCGDVKSLSAVGFFPLGRSITRIRSKLKLDIEE